MYFSLLIANIFFIFVILPVRPLDENLTKIDYYQNLIDDNRKRAENFVFPKNAKERPYCDLGNIKDFGTYDFIIVGAGATGTVLANRLSENKDVSVLLLEAGDFTNDFVEIPGMQTLVELSDYDWHYTSVPQRTACLGMKENVCVYPIGKGLGGTTLINSLVYSRGNARDFDLWEKKGNPGWAYKDVLPYFKKSEDYHHRDPNATVYWPSHGVEGPLYTEYPLPETFIGKTFTEACKELGYKSIDFNGPEGIGYSFPPLNTKNGKRWDGGTAFVLPVLSRDNLKVEVKSYVIKVNIDENTARGVTFCQKGTTYKVKANKEVIVSAGTIATPHLLLLSGIGPRKHLQRVGVPLVQNLEVGSALRDHTKYYGLIFSTNHTEQPRTTEEYIKEYLNGLGPYSLAGGVGAILYAQSQLEKTPNYPDLEALVIPPNSTSIFSKKLLGWTDEAWKTLWEGKDLTKYFCIMISHLHTVSTGTVRLKSSDPFEYPLINSRFMSDSKGHDIEALYQGIQLILKLVKTTKSFKEINATLALNTLSACNKFKYNSKKWWFCAIRQLSSNNYHPHGSCPMGPNPLKGDVVDFELKVHGLKRLRVADASIFPISITGHPNAPCVMVGEKLSDMLIKQYKL